MIDNKKISLDSLIEDIKIANDSISPEFISQGDILNGRIVEIDGYSLNLKFNRRRNGSVINETLSISAENHTFLPFNLLCKLAKKFLGQHELFLYELVDEFRKIYIWSVSLDHEGKPIATYFKNKYEVCTYDDFSYIHIIPIIRY
jgi:hypothetical protein